MFLVSADKLEKIVREGTIQQTEANPQLGGEDEIMTNAGSYTGGPSVLPPTTMTQPVKRKREDDEEDELIQPSEKRYKNTVEPSAPTPSTTLPSATTRA